MTTGNATSDTTTRPSLLAVFRVPEFRALWSAEILSSIGDQFARVALAVAVFERTDSAALTGLAYAMTFVPAVLGGTLLGWLGDRYPRRTVMVIADVLRAILIGIAAVPHVPIWLLLVLIAGVALVNGPFKAAQQAMLPDVLQGPSYVSGMAVRSISLQAAQLIGFAGGGLLVTGSSASLAFAVDAVTFAASALVITLGVRARSATWARPLSLRSVITGGGGLVWRNRRLRTLTALVWLAAFYVVPEALAAPYAAQLGAGGLAVGLILAADPIGSVIGGVIWGRWVPIAARERWVAWLGVAAGVPLVFCALRPPLVASLVLFAISGAFATAYTVQGVSTFTTEVPDERRAQASGLLSTGLLGVQGVGVLLAGILAEAVGAAGSISAVAAAGVVVAIPIGTAVRNQFATSREPPRRT